jgi:outer membrane protein OmpA-like peptidoglycan-associated protein/tetratricopeptide (TPR) repeat protein
MKKLFHIAILFLFAAGALVAQPIRDLPRAKKVNIAEEKMATGDYYSALEMYEEIYDDDQSRGETDVDVVAAIADLQNGFRDFKKAERWYSRLLSKDKEGKYPTARFEYARVLKKMGKYDEAKVEFENFLKGSNIDAKFQTLANNELAGIALAKKMMDGKKEEVIIDNIGSTINSPSSDGSPVAINRDEIIYSSLSRDSIIQIDPKVPNEPGNFSRLFRAKKTADGYSAPEPLGVEINKPGFHSSSPAFSFDRKTMYFTRCTYNVGEAKNCRILKCDFDGAEFKNVTELNFNGADYSSKQPTVAKIDGKEALIFSSDMSGGQGGYDLWYALKQADGSFSTPLNLGAKVNTIGDEVTPHFFDGVLYFSSDAHPGMGGFDIFSSDYLNNGSWGNVDNMGAAFNTSLDDIYFAIGEDPCYAFLVSNRPGTISLKSETCCDDIFSMITPERCPVEVNVKTFDVRTNAALSGCQITLYDDKGVKVDQATNAATNNSTFKLQRNKTYKVVATRNGYTEATGTVTTNNLQVDKPSILDTKLYLDPGVLATVKTFDARSRQPLTGVKVTLFDAKGAALDTKTTTGSNEVTFNLTAGEQYRFDGTRESYAGDSKPFQSAEAKTSTVIELYLGLPLLDTIYYDFDKFNIRPDAAAKLDEITATLKAFPALVVEVGSHTDALGSNAYNDALAEKRTASAMAYLEAAGIDKSRLVPKAYGEVIPAAPNTTAAGADDPVGRQRNRRTEFKIVRGFDGAPSSTNGEKPAEQKKNN